MMNEPLFFEPEPITYLEKVSGEVDLPDDPNQWPQEILQELYKQVPYIADYQPHVEMKRADAERGYGLGHVEIKNQTEAPQEATEGELEATGIRTVRIPFVIKENKLSPFDLLLNDMGKMLPLTENRLRTSLFRPQAFDVTSRTPGDQSMIGQLYPPYRQNYGFGGGGVAMNASGGMGMGKLGSALEEYITPMPQEDLNKQAMARAPHDVALRIPAKKYASVLDGALAAVAPEDHASFIDELTKGASYIASNRPNLHERVPEALDKIIEATPFSFKLAGWRDIVPPSVVQLQKRNDGYLMKMASHEAWNPTSVVIDRGELVRRFGERVAMDVDTAGGATIQETEEEPPVGEEAKEEFASITQFGLYKVKDSVGKEHVGFVIPSLIDMNGDDVPIKLFTNGTVVAVQADMMGEPAGTGANLPAAPVSGEGFFWGMRDDGTVSATVPFKFTNSQAVAQEPTVFNGETFDGLPAQASVQDNLQRPVGESGKLLVPSHWNWMPLDGSESIVVLGDEDQVAAEGEPKKEGQVVIRSDGQTFSFEGAPVEKLSYDQTKFLDVNGAMFLLAGLGVHQAHGVEKLAQAVQGGASSSVQVRRPITTDEAMRKQASGWRAGVKQLTDSIKQPHLIKEAASIPDPTTVDTVLSLGFVNPDNLMNFVSYLPDMDAVQSKLCELLLGVRLGVSSVPQSALERSIRSLEEVIEGLKIIAFQGS